MTETPTTPVAGYRPQAPEALERVNENKRTEERLLRRLEQDMARGRDNPKAFDGRWGAIARTHLEQAYMAWNRAIFQPARIDLPEDEK